MALGDLVVRLSADIAEFRNDMGRAVSTTQSSMAKIDAAVDDAKRNIGNTLKGAVAAFGAIEIAQFSGRIIAATAALDDMSEKTGASVESLSALRRVADISGQNFDTVGSAMAKLAKNLAGIDDESKGAGKALGAIGLEVEKIKALQADQQMLTIAKAMNEFADGSGKAAASQAIFSKSGAELLPYLKDLAEAGELNATVTAEQAAEAEKLQKAFNALKADFSEVATTIASDVLPYLQLMLEGIKNVTTATGDMSTGFSPVKETLKALIVVASEVGFVFKGVGTEIGGIAAQLAALGSGNFSGFSAIRDAMVKDAEAARKAQDAYVAGVMGIGAATEKAADKVEGAKKKLEFSSVKESAKEAKKDVDELGAALNKVFAKQSGFDADYLKTVGLFATLLDGTSEGAARFTEAMFALNGQQKVFKDAADAAAKAEQDWAAGVDRATVAARESISAQYDRAIAAEAELKTYGLTKSAIEEVTIARLEEQARMADSVEGQEAVVANLEKEIAARKRVAAALRGTEAKDAAKKAAEDATKAWEKFSDDIERALTDSLMRGFESGKGFGEAFVDSLKNTLKTAALKIVVQAIVDPVTGSIRNAVTGGQGGPSLSNLSNLFSGTPTLDSFQRLANSNIGSQFLTTESPLGGRVLTDFGGTVSEFANAVDTYGGYVNSIYQLTEGNYGAAIGSAVGQAIGGPIGSLIGNTIGSAVDKAFGSKGGPKQAGGFTDIMGQSVVSGTLNDQAKGYAIGAEAAFANIAARYGIKTATGASAAISVDPQGTANTDLGLILQNNGQTIYDRAARFGGSSENVGRTPEELQAAMDDALTEALLFGVARSDGFPTAVTALFDTFEAKIGDLSAARGQGLVTALAGGWLDDLLDSLVEADAAGSSLEAVADAAAKLAAVAPLKPLFDALGVSFIKLGAQVTDALGGLESAGSALAAYYSGFYSEAERAQRLQADVAAVFADIGITVPESKDAFRALVDGLDLTTDAGRRTYAALIKVAPSFATVADVAAEAAKKAIDTAKEAAKEAVRLADAQRKAIAESVDNAYGVLENAVIRDKEAIERSAQSQLEGIADRVTTLTDTLGGLKALVDSVGHAIRSIEAETIGITLQSRARARAELITAATIARAGGPLPSADALAPALSQLSAPAENLFGNRTDFLRDQAQNRAALVSLRDIGSAQVSIDEQMLDALEDQKKTIEESAEAQIAALDAQLDAARQQVDALKGIDVSVLSVADAIRNLDTATRQAPTSAPPGTVTVGGGTVKGGGAEYFKPFLNAPLAVTDPGEVQRFGVIDDYLRSTYDGGTEQWMRTVYDKAQESGVNQQEIGIALGLSEEEVRKEMAKFGIPAFARGTNYVPDDMFAQIHQGERIIPAADNRAIMSAIGNADLQGALVAIQAELIRLRQDNSAENRSIAAATSKTARTLDRVTPDGDAIAMTAVLDAGTV